MGTIIILVICLLAFLILIVYPIAKRNEIVRNKNNSMRAWADVITYQRRKIQIIPEFERGIKEHKEFEVGFVSKLTELRSAIGELSDKKIDLNKMKEVQQQTKSLLAGFNATFENYPQLKTTDLYKKWMNALEESENNIAAAITIFNESIEQFNNTIQQFPGNIINNMLNKENVLNTFTDTEAEKGIEFQPNFNSKKE